jgi:hypothetical protein
MRRSLVAVLTLAAVSTQSSSQQSADLTRRELFQRTIIGASVGAAVGAIAGPSQIVTVCESMGPRCDGSRWIANGGGAGFLLGAAIGAAAGAQSDRVGVPGLLANFGLALVSGVPAVMLADKSATPAIALAPIVQAAVVAWRTDRALTDKRRHEGLNPLPKPTLHEGMWVAIGAGGGGADIGCSGCAMLASSDPWRGGAAGAGFIAVGKTLASGRLLGAELDNWSRSASSRNASQTSILAVLQTYSGDSPLYSKIGLGIGSVDLGQNGRAQWIAGGGPAASFGVGYDWRISTSIALSPYAAYSAILPLAQRGEGDIGSIPRSLMGHFQAGVALAWY